MDFVLWKTISHIICEQDVRRETGKNGRQTFNSSLSASKSATRLAPPPSSPGPPPSSNFPPPPSAGAPPNSRSISACQACSRLATFSFSCFSCVRTDSSSDSKFCFWDWRLCSSDCDCWSSRRTVVSSIWSCTLLADTACCASASAFRICSWGGDGGKVELFRGRPFLEGAIVHCGERFFPMILSDKN